MANGFDRLERFFSKKRSSSARSSADSGRASSSLAFYAVETTAVSQSTIPTFPQPSFIRPKTSRMIARQETTAKSPKRSRSAYRLSDAPSNPKRLSSGDAHDISNMSMRSSLSSNETPQVPHRSSSLLYRRQEQPIAGMVPLQIARPTPHSREGSLSSTGSASPVKQLQAKSSYALKRLQDPLPIYPHPRVDTPPPSDPDDNCSSSSPVRRVELPRGKVSDQPTPGPSPELHPVQDSLLPEPQVTEAIDSAEAPPLSEPAQTPLPRTPSLRAISSDPGLHAAFKSLADSPASTLEEPRVGEFLRLSDNDIAESGLPPLSPPPSRLPPKPPVPPPSTRTLLMASMGDPIMPSSPLAARAATIAALEAARIAKKYDLDLLYIVNLWPVRKKQPHHDRINSAGSQESLAPPSPSSPPSPRPLLSCDGPTPRNSLFNAVDLGNGLDGDTTTPCINPQTGMTGRILAAFGLAEVCTPFRLSAGVHKKVLRTQGWIEYRQPDPKPDEFARGYACSFYTGCSQEGRCTSSSDMETDVTSGLPSPKTKSRPRCKRGSINRGIVFAAYRKPREDGGSISSSPAELSAMHEDAEALVELLIDLHVAQRHRQMAKETKKTRLVLRDTEA